MNYYIDLFLSDIKRKHFKPGKPVVHRATCPVCGRQRVNLYFKDGEWKCRQCWDE